MSIATIACKAFDDQKPGTSGLRKQTRRFQEPGYLETFVQSIFRVMPPSGPLVVGGDGRFFNAEAIQTILRIAAANGARQVIVGQDGLLSTPAASHLVRHRKACGAIILSASHNPAGPDGDFGVKFNIANGAPAPEELTGAVYEESRKIEAYSLFQGADLDLSRPGRLQLGPLEVEVVDPASDYADLMETLFDFDQIGALLRKPGFSLCFDAMNAVTGPYAREILVRRLGADPACLMRATPLTDFGHAHPDPTPANAPALVEALRRAGGPSFGAASDGDGDRHMILGRDFHVNPSDSLAVLTANAELAPGYRGRMSGVARSMPTSRAVDVVARALGIPVYETPTGWKFFGSLLDAGSITLCGEESAGAGSDHVREKDGLWAVLFWLNLVAARGLSVSEIVQDHWGRFGRHACQRHDYDGLSVDAAESLMAELKSSVRDMGGRRVAGLDVASADVFDYEDPVNGAVARDQGVRIFLEGGGRVVFRLSGTGTSGATLRVYLEQLVTDHAAMARPAAELVAELGVFSREAARILHFCDRRSPSAVV